MAKIALIGPGAIGATLVAWLAQDARHTITVAARTAFERIDVETPTRSLTATPRVITAPAPAASELVDWVLIATKTYDAAGAAAWLPGFLGEATRVAIVQNGVEHIERFEPFLPRAKMVPVMIDLPAERSAPGKIRQRGPGRMVVPAGEAGRAFVELFAQTEIAVSENADFKSQVWRKLCVNSAGALSAIVLRPAVIARHDGVTEIMRQIVRECRAVGRAEGAQLDDAIVETVVAGYRNAPPDALNSMHADRIAGRPMEIDARNGVIVRLGRKHGIATPLNAMIVALLEAAQG